MSSLILADHLGPEKVVHIRKPGIGLDAILVIDNVAAGPAIGGVRMAHDVTLEECQRLARAMTLKNAAAGLPHGGGKAVIQADPGCAPRKKEELIRAFACLIREFTDYIPGPDMGTNETAMAWVKDEIGRSVGLPRVIGGIPLDEIGATGLGLTVAIKTAEAHCDVEIPGSRVAIQGFGAVGKHAARFLAERGAKIVAVSDSAGTVIDPGGLDVATLITIKGQGGKVVDLDSPNVDREQPEAVIASQCDILIPAARPDVIRSDNVGSIRAKLIVEGANIPATEDAERELHRRGVMVIPDFVANAGGVICGAVEYHGGDENQAIAAITEKIGQNVDEVLKTARQREINPRKAAEMLALKRVEEAMTYSRFR